jgi:hypothetical protein
VLPPASARAARIRAIVPAPMMLMLFMMRTYFPDVLKEL